MFIYFIIIFIIILFIFIWLFKDLIKDVRDVDKDIRTLKGVVDNVIRSNIIKSNSKLLFNMLKIRLRRIVINFHIFVIMN